MRVVLRAGLDTISGYGNDGCDIAAWMDKQGIDVTLWPTGVTPAIPGRVARLLTKAPRPPFDVVLSFMPPFDLKPWEFGSVAERSVGWTMWERTPMVEQDMADHGWDEEARAGTGRWWSGRPDGGTDEDVGFQRVPDTWGLDRLLVTCPMNRQAFATLDPHVDIGVLPCGIDPDRWPYVKRDPKAPMVFGWVGTGAMRKDPFALLEAWRELKQAGQLDGAVLQMKITGPGIHPKVAGVYPDVEIFNGSWPADRYVKWLQTVDVMVSTSRGEGNNKPAMECMATGGTAIASDWSGHQNWLLPGVTWGVRGELMPRTDPAGTFDFRVDREHLKQCLLDAHGDRGGTARRGEKASTWVRDALSWSKIVTDLEKMLWALR